VALPSVEYTPRDPGGSVLQQIVREHFETFRAEAAHLRDGEGLPRFVEEEFEAFLRCGWLAGARHHSAIEPHSRPRSRPRGLARDAVSITGAGGVPSTR
jgi:hypothetical protein